MPSTKAPSNLLSNTLLNISNNGLSKNPTIKDANIDNEPDHLLSTIYDNISDHVVIQDIEGKVLYANKAAILSAHRPANKIIGTPCYKIWNDDDKRCDNCPLEKALASGKNQEEVLVTSDNRYWQIKGIPLRNDKGEISHLLEISKEITNEKKAAIELENHQKTNQAILDALPNFIFILDTQGKILDVHTSLEDSLYAPKDKIIGKLITHVLPAKVSKKISSHIHNLVKTKETQHFFYSLRTDKQHSYYDARLMLMENNKVIAIVKDITARRMAENALKITEKRFQELAKLLPQTIFEIDTHGNIVYTNEYGFKLTGYTQKDLEKGMSIFHMIPSKEHEKLKANFSNLLTRQKVTPHEYLIRKKNGTTFPVLIYTSPMYYNKKHIGYRGVIADISTIKRTENELIKAKEKAEEADRIKTAFLENISHEIRTPLNGIMGLSELLKEKNIPAEDMEHYVDIIVDRGKHLLCIINDIIDIAKIESGQLFYKPKHFALNNMLDKLFTRFSLLKNNHKDKIDFSIKKGLKNKEDKVYTDPYMLEQILLNLLSNAFKYTRAGSISLAYSMNKKQSIINFTIKDTGIGIPKDKQHLIFDRFRQADESKTKSYGGTGLGLTISKKLVDLLGGDIWVESEFNKGSLFSFSIPCNIFCENSIANQKKSFNWKNKKILIVEDDPSSFYYIKAALKNTDAKIFHAVDGETAIDICKSDCNIDLILMDIQLPKTDGLTATKKIRKFNKDIPIIIETAHAMKQDQQRSLDAGSNDYISKPFERNKLLSVISKYI